MADAFLRGVNTFLLNPATMQTILTEWVKLTIGPEYKVSEVKYVDNNFRLSVELDNDPDQSR